jgi:hypothetical protein
MLISVYCYFVARGRYFAHQARGESGFGSEHKKCGLPAQIVKGGENGGSRNRVGAVIKGKRHMAGPPATDQIGR